MAFDESGQKICKWRPWCSVNHSKVFDIHHSYNIIMLRCFHCNQYHIMGSYGRWFCDKYIYLFTNSLDEEIQAFTYSKTNRSSLRSCFVWACWVSRTFVIHSCVYICLLRTKCWVIRQYFKQLLDLQSRWRHSSHIEKYDSLVHCWLF